MKDASSDASHRIGQAISSGAAQRPARELSSRAFFPRPRLRWKSVYVEPGHTALTRMPRAGLLVRERAREREQRSLAGVVDRHAFAARQRVAGRHVDDAAAAGLAQRRQRRPAEVRGAEQVHIQHRAPLFRRRVGDRRIVSHRRVVDQDVDPAEPLERLCDRRLGERGVGDVAGHDFGPRSELLFRFLKRLGIKIEQENPRALLAEELRRGRPNARAAARDQGNFIS